MLVVDLLRVNGMTWCIECSGEYESQVMTSIVKNVQYFRYFSFIITHTQRTRTRTTYSISKKGCREQIYVMKNRDGVGAQMMKMLKLSKENGEKKINRVKKKWLSGERMDGEKKNRTKENRQYGTISEQ